MYIQLGAFGQSSNADRLRGTLEADFPTVHVQPFWSNQQRLFRVRIGPYATVQEIESTVLDLEQQGYANAIVVIE
jgi:rare lipoprotein A